MGFAVLKVCAAQKCAAGGLRRRSDAPTPSGRRDSRPPRGLLLWPSGSRTSTTAASASNRRQYEHDLSADYYQILGLQASASVDDVKCAYKHLAKQTHPDIAGDEVAGIFTVINRAYQVLSDPQTRVTYDSGRALFGKESTFHDFTGEPLSRTARPGDPLAMFVDENSCIGCRACIHEAPLTFAMDAIDGKARVAMQWGDDHDNIYIAQEMCPVNCIHQVMSCDLAVLEYVQKSMPRRTHIINSNNSDSGRARGMDESPFVAAERFEGKKTRLLEEAKARADAAARAQALNDALTVVGVNVKWQPWRKAKAPTESRSTSKSVVGQNCPIVTRNSKFQTGPLLLPESAAK